jgi:histidinol dehydrogenase
MIKVLKFKNKNSLKALELFLNKRKSFQKKQTLIVSKIIQNVKKNGDKAVINYEKQFSKIKSTTTKLLYSNK